MWWFIGGIITAVTSAVGCAVAYFCKEEQVETLNMKGGLVREDCFKVTNSIARTFAKWATLWLSEYVMSHKYLNHSKYFHDGKLLGESRKEAADTANKEGIKLMRSGEFSKAKGYFEAAGELSTEDEKKSIQQNRNNAEAEIFNQEGEEHMKNGNFEKAKESFNTAYQLCADEERKEIFRAGRNCAEAEILNKRGTGHMENNKFEEAMESFEAALILCTDEKRRKVFQINQTNTAAELFYKKGQTIFNQTDLGEKRYVTAQQLFIKALNTCSENYKNKEKFQKSNDDTEVIINQVNAKESFESGMILWSSACRNEDDEQNDRSEQAMADFVKAERKFQEALKLVSNDLQFQNWARATRYKIQGNKLFNESLRSLTLGDKYMTEEKYQLARCMYEEAQKLGAKAIHEFQEGFNVVKAEKFKDDIKSTRPHHEYLSSRMREASLLLAASLSSIENRNASLGNEQELRSFEVINLGVVNQL